MDNTNDNDHRATYCPEDNKLRLYVGRVPREEYNALRAEGWTTLHKQREAGGGDFVAVWTPQRRDTALQYAGVIEDEDMGPEERAADRAERFAGYRGKRLSEAGELADNFDAGPQAHGFQSEARAERAARRHDLKAARAVDAWGKAEYWQRRTAGVISHALHRSSSGVRMGRIKDLEANIRRCEEQRAAYAKEWDTWCQLQAMKDPEQQTALCLRFVGGTAGGDYSFKHPRADLCKNPYFRTNRTSLYSLMTCEDQPISGAEACAMWFARYSCPTVEEGDWLTHYRLRLAYELQMIAEQGGLAAFVEMEVGGWIGKKQIRKVNKSPETGRVVSVTLKISGDRWGNRSDGFHFRAVNIERLDVDAYRAPSDEDRAALAAEKKAEKAAAPKVDCPLINPTDDDAARLQALWNATWRPWGRDDKAPAVTRMTQEQYSAASKGSYARAKTVEITGGGFREKAAIHMRSPDFPSVAKVRTLSGAVVILADKPQKALTAKQWYDPRPGEMAELAEHVEELAQALRSQWLPDGDTPERKLIVRAERCDLVAVSSLSQFGWTTKGAAWAKEVGLSATACAMHHH